MDVLDSAEGEWEGYGAELEVGKFAAVEKPEVSESLSSFNLATAHADALLMSGGLSKFWT